MTVGFAKSVTYFFTFPSSKATFKDCSSINLSLAKFRRITPSFIFAIISFEIIPLVESRRGA